MVGCYICGIELCIYGMDLCTCGIEPCICGMVICTCSKELCLFGIELYVKLGCVAENVESYEGRLGYLSSQSD